MSLAALINRPCTIVRRDESGDEDEYGNDIPTEARVDTFCELQQRSRTEPGDQGEMSDSQWTVFLYPEESVSTGDAIEVDGETYEVTGEPWRARNPRTRETHHIEVTCRRTAGATDEVGS